MSDQSPILQILFNEKIIWYEGISVTGSGVEFDKFLSGLPKTIFNENDRIQFFTYYSENHYKIEKVKTIYDFKLKKTRDIIYDPEIFSEDIAYLFEKSKLFYEDLKRRELFNTKEQIKSDIKKQLTYRVVSLRAFRDRLLENSDWTQSADIPFSDVDKNNWIKFRQVLRDLPDQESWDYSTAYTILFPIDPSTYKLRYPNYEVEYLSTPDQYENQKANKEKEKIIAIVKQFNLPSIKIENLTQLDYINLIAEVNQILYKIDPDLKVAVSLVRDPNDMETENAELMGDVKMSFDYSGFTPEVLNYIETYIVKSNKYTETEISQFMETLKILQSL